MMAYFVLNVEYHTRHSKQYIARTNDMPLERSETYRTAPKLFCAMSGTWKHQRAVRGLSGALRGYRQIRHFGRLADTAKLARYLQRVRAMYEMPHDVLWQAERKPLATRLKV